MNIVDRTGRKVKVGQLVNVHLNGMYECKVIDIRDQAIVLSSNQQIVPHLVLVCPINCPITPNGMAPDAYITQEPDPKDELVKQSEGKLRIVKPS